MSTISRIIRRFSTTTTTITTKTPSISEDLYKEKNLKRVVEKVVGVLLFTGTCLRRVVVSRNVVVVGIRHDLRRLLRWEIDLAWRFLARLRTRTGCKTDLISFNNLLIGVWEWGGLVDRVREKVECKAFEVFESWSKNITPDMFSYNAVINGFCNNGDLQEAKKWYWEHIIEVAKVNYSSPTIKQAYATSDFVCL
ncbi:pentatricopeptide repeat-containing protein [Tanacetum coccineum]